MALTNVNWRQIDALLDLAFAEDIGDGDATTQALTTGFSQLTARFVARDDGVFSGGEIAKRWFEKIDREIKWETLTNDGDKISVGQPLIKISGAARSLLTGERVALNFMQRMSGIATTTRKYVDAVNGTAAKIYDTRKTLPGHRALDKLAVLHGGGANHRLGLFDMILIKDNHLALAEIGCPADAIKIARQKSTLPIMVEVDTLPQLENALSACPDFILLDNMPPEILRAAVTLAKNAFQNSASRPQLEASGGITLTNIRAVAETGVDRISVGALTHSVTALDIGLDAE